MQVNCGAFYHERRTHCDLGAISAGPVQSFRRISTSNMRSGGIVLFCGVCEVPGLKIVLASFIDRLLACLSECEFAGNHISNAGPNVVMDSDVAVWGKREFGGA